MESSQRGQPDDRFVVSGPVRVARDELRFTFSRSSGPGGQNVNKVNTKVQMRWNVAQSPSLTDAVRTRFFKKYGKRITSDGHLLVSSQRYRDQRRNVDDCLQKLQAMLAAVSTPPKRRKKTKPSRAAKERRLKQKRQHSQKKQLRRPPEQ